VKISVHIFSIFPSLVVHERFLLWKREVRLQSAPTNDGKSEMNEKNHQNKRTILLAAILSSVSSYQIVFGQAAPSYALSSSEQQTLTQWKQTAPNTALGTLLLQLLNDCDRKLALNSQDANSRYKRGYLYGVIGCTESAIADLTQTIEIAPSHSRAFTERGLCYMDQKQYTRALYDLNRAVQIHPQSGNALMARARLWLATGRPLLAINDLRYCQSSEVKFAAELPGELSANQYNALSYYLGASYEALDRPEQAINYYKECLKTAQTGTVGYLHRYAEQPIDTKWRIANLERATGGL
jgi:tetratricopeptide (TPR) repeat protein